MVGAPVQTLSARPAFDGTGSVSTLNLTVEVTTTAGNALVVHGEATGIVTVTRFADSKGNAWTIDAQQSDRDTVFIARSDNRTPLVPGDTVAPTLSRATELAFGGEEFPGGLTPRTTASAYGGDLGGSALSGGALLAPPVEPDELVIAAWVGQGALSFRAGTGYTALQLAQHDINFIRTCGAEYKLTADWSAQAPAASWTTTAIWTGVAVAYAPSAPGASIDTVGGELLPLDIHDGSAFKRAVAFEQVG